MRANQIGTFVSRQTRRRFLQTSGVAFLTATLSNCGWRLGEVGDKKCQTPTSKSNKLYIYTWTSYSDDDLLNNFRKATGIEVSANIYDSNEEMLAKIQAGGGADYSVIYPSDYMVIQMAELKLLRPLDGSQLTGLENLLPKFQNPVYDPGNRYSVPFSWGTTGFIYNPAKLQPEPEDWDYLWKYQKQLHRRMTLLNDMREVMGAALRMLGYSYNSTNAQQIKAAYDKLKTLKPSVAAFTSDSWRSQILSGDLVLAICYSSDANEVIKENPKFKYVVPRSGSSLWTDTLAIPQCAPNPGAAYAWIDYMMQPEVAAAICERLSFPTANRAAYNMLPDGVRNNLVMFPPDSTIAQCESIAPVWEFSAIYDRYWTELTST